MQYITSDISANSCSGLSRKNQITIIGIQSIEPTPVPDLAGVVPSR